LAKKVYECYVVSGWPEIVDFTAHVRESIIRAIWERGHNRELVEEVIEGSLPVPGGSPSNLEELINTGSAFHDENRIPFFKEYALQHPPQGLLNRLLYCLRVFLKKEAVHNVTAYEYGVVDGVLNVKMVLSPKHAEIVVSGYGSFATATGRVAEEVDRFIQTRISTIYWDSMMTTVRTSHDVLSDKY